LIRHAALRLAIAVGPLPVAMIEPAFGTSLVPQIGVAPLLESRPVTAGETAIALAAVAVQAEPEHGKASLRTANPLPENDFAVIVHLPSQAGLDNGNGFVSG
jgi:hypothetical protein